MMGEDVQHSFTLIGSHIIESLSPLLSHYLSFSFCLSFLLCLYDSVFWELSQSDDFGCRVLGLYNIRAKICVR